MKPHPPSSGKSNRIRAPRRPFDIVHLAQTTFPEDPRPRREAMLAAETGARVAIIVMAGGRDARKVCRYGRVVVIRLAGKRGRGSAGKYLAEYLDFLLRARALIHRDSRFRHARVFHVHSLPDFLVAATRRSRREGSKVILDLHEIFPEFTRSKFTGWKGAVGEPIARWLERWSRRQADIVLTVNQAVAAQLKRRPAGAGERILVVHNFADPGEFGPPKLTNGQTHDSLRLVYHGTLTPLYGVDLAVDGVARARQRGTRVEFDIFGDGPDRQALRRQIDRLGMQDHIRLGGTVPYQELVTLLPGFDAGLIATRLDGMTRFSLSTKLLEYVHLGLPLIIPEIPTYLHYFSEDCAWYFRPDSALAVAEAIEAFAMAAREERIRRASAAQIASTRQLDPVREGAMLRELYLELMHQPR